MKKKSLISLFNLWSALLFFLFSFTGYAQSAIELQEKINLFTAKIENVKKQIETLNFYKNVEDFEKWSKLTEKEKKDLKIMNREFLIDVFVINLGKGVDELASINLRKAQNVQKKMESLGITNPYAQQSKILQRGIILIGQAKNKKEKAEAAKIFIECFGEVLKKGLAESENDPTQFDQFKEAIGISQLILLMAGKKNPAADLTITATMNAYTLIDATAGLYYGYKDVDNMTKQTEANLKNLKVWTELMKEYIYEVNVFKRELTSLIRNSFEGEMDSNFFRPEW